MKRKWLGLIVTSSFLVYAWNLSWKVQELQEQLRRLERSTRNYVEQDTKNHLELIHTIKYCLDK